jgi:hypothetical protein
MEVSVMKKIRLILIAVVLSLGLGLAAFASNPVSAIAHDGDPPPVCPSPPCEP